MAKYIYIIEMGNTSFSVCLALQRQSHAREEEVANLINANNSGIDQPSGEERRILRSRPGLFSSLRSQDQQEEPGEPERRILRSRAGSTRSTGAPITGFNSRGKFG